MLRLPSNPPFAPLADGPAGTPDAFPTLSEDLESGSCPVILSMWREADLYESLRKSTLGAHREGPTHQL